MRFGGSGVPSLRPAATCGLTMISLAALLACDQARPGEDDVAEDRPAVSADVAATRDFDSGALPRARRLTDQTFEATPARRERGRYLVESVLGCVLCHSERDWDAPGAPPIDGKQAAGVVLWEREGRRMVAPNLTPDSATGSGAWPDDALARAIREGVGHDGRALSLPMYWNSFSSLSDEDLASVIVYVRSLPPVRNPLPARSLPPEAVAELAERPRPISEPVPEPDLSDPVARGRYLIEIADCVGCHTAWYSDPMPGEFGGGNEVGRGRDVYSANITPDESGIGGWSEEQFVQVIRTGKGGTLDPIMPWVVYGRMTDLDLRAIYQALRLVPPVRHWINNAAPPTYCEVCGQEHGLGERNEPLRIVPADVPTAVLTDYEGRYVNESEGPVELRLLDGSLRIIFAGEDTLEMVPLSEARFHVPGIVAPIEFVRDAASGVIGFRVRQGLDEEEFLRER